MTGFGVASVPLCGGIATIEVRAVNGRFADVRVRTPREIAEHSTFVEQYVRGRLARGRVEVGVRLDDLSPPSVSLDKQRALDALRALSELRDELQFSQEIPLSLLATVPELFKVSQPLNANEVREGLTLGLERALTAMHHMRKTEGEALEADLLARLTQIQLLISEVVAFSAGRPDRLRARLRERIERMLGSIDGTVDPARLEQEIAILADHGDIAEELARLASHCSQFATLCSQSEPVGRKLDFLLQEIGREVNTLGAKANDAELSIRVVEVKAEVERMREQVQNVE
jgi:uncharacterized protein (TIGR00255 family)